MLWNKIKEKLVKVKKEENIVKPESYSQQRSRKGGKYYAEKLIYDRTGLQGMRKSVRNKHQKMWGKYKRFIAPNSRLYYVWIHGTDKYKCIALVEGDLKI
jgi:hypothetical protein